MRLVNIFLFEFNHFFKNRSKVFSYLIFLLACIYSLYNGFDLQKKQNETINKIEQKFKEETLQVFNWFENGEKGPESKPWIDITNPYWTFNYTNPYVIKSPSPLLPLGIGQTEQYGYYKKITNWSSTYDNDMIEEIANPERLVNGNIDFSFLVIFLLPILLIIFTYNISGLEKDLQFEKLINIQFGSFQKWIRIRILFYVLLLIIPVIFFIVGVAFINDAILTHSSIILSLILISIIYVLFFTLTFYLLVISSNGSTEIAFKMISVWLLLCVIIPGSVHQYASMMYPVNYMTDYLDVNRKEAYEVFELSTDSLYYRLVEIYPQLSETRHGTDEEINISIIGNTVCTIVNELNKNTIDVIEEKNELKNQLIRSSYWFNPISYIQNRWNRYLLTDYYTYKDYRLNVQKAIDRRLNLLTFECWNQQEVTKLMYQNYLKELK